MGNNRKRGEEDIAEVIRRKLEAHKRERARVGKHDENFGTSYQPVSREPYVASDIFPVEDSSSSIKYSKLKPAPYEPAPLVKPVPVKEKKRKVPWILVIIIILIILGIFGALLFVFLGEFFANSSERYLQVNEDLGGAIVTNESYVLITLSDEISLDSISNVSFIFESKDGTDYPYSPGYVSKEYKINAVDLGLESFRDIEAVDAIIIYKPISSSGNETPVVPVNITTNQTTNQTNQSKLGGGGGGGGGGCIPNCAGKQCGGNGCGGTCGTCNTGYECSSTGNCVELINCTTDVNCSYLTGVCGIGLCNQTAKQCYASYNSSTNLCREDTSECDVIETCSGSSVSCQDDLNKSNGAVCSIGTCQDGKCIFKEALVAYWNFNGNALDSVGNNHGEIQGNSTYVNGISNQGIKFDGDGDYVNFSDSDNLEIYSHDYSIGFWVKAQKFQKNYSGILWKGGLSRDNQYKICFDGSGERLRHYYYSTGADKNETALIDTTKALNDSVWHHVVLTIDRDGNYTWYIDWHLDTADLFNETTNVDTGAISLEVGRANIDGFNGTLDEVKIWNYALSEGEVWQEYAALKSGKGLISSWSFEGNSLDSMGKNNGEIIGGPEYTGGVQGQAIKVSSGNYVNIPDSASLDINNELTILAWVKKETFVNHGKVVVKRFDDYNTNPWELYSLDFKGASPGYPCFLISNGSAGSQNGLCDEDNLLPLNEWHHLAGIYNGSLMSLFVDGVFEGSLDASIQIGTNDMPLTIGAINSSDFYTNGAIDEVMIFNRALSSEEISDIYNEQASSVPSLSLPERFFRWIRNFLIS